MPTFSKIQDDPTVASSHGSMRDSLRTTSNLSKGDVPINFSFRSTTSNEFDRLVNGEAANPGVNARNWSRPPNVSPVPDHHHHMAGSGITTSPGQSAGKKTPQTKRGVGQSPAANSHNKPVSPRASQNPNNTNNNNNSVAAAAAKKVANNNNSVSASPARNQNNSINSKSSGVPAKKGAPSPEMSKAKAAERNAIRRALGGGDDDEFEDGGDQDHATKSSSGAIPGTMSHTGSMENDSGMLPTSFISDNTNAPNRRKGGNNNNNNGANYLATAPQTGGPLDQSGRAATSEEEGEEEDMEGSGGQTATTSNANGNGGGHGGGGDPGKSVSSNSDESDPSDYESMGGSSTSSASSNARRAKEMKARPIMCYMISLIAVPIIFLTIYQAINVGTALASLRFMQDHSTPILHMISLQADLQDEMLAASHLIGERVARGLSGEQALPVWVPQHVKDLNARVDAFFTGTRESLRSLLIEVSGGDGAIPSFHQKGVRLPESLSKAEIHARRNNGQAYRDELIYIMTEISAMLAILQADSRAKLFSVHLIDMQLLTRIEEYFAKLTAMYEEIEAGVNKSNVYWQDFRGGSKYVANVVAHENSTAASSSTNTETVMTADAYYASITEYCLLFSQTYNRLTAYADYLIVGSGDDIVQNTLQEFMATGFDFHRQAFRPFLDCSIYSFTNRSNVTWADAATIEAIFTAQRNKISAAIDTLFDSIVNNEEVQQGAVVEGMKLFAAIVACVIGVAIVIQIQKKERSELFKIIDHSERLSTAVRRFVPKNQLRMMGVRSVLQVSPGFNVEVANTLVSSSIGSFEQIAESMSRLELFDWLQMYVARITYVVQQSRGYIDGIRGDRILSVFSQGTDGVTASVMMQQEADHMNVDLIATKATELIRISVGVHHCVHVGGMVGDDNRLACVLVSSDVNLCSRLEGLTKVYKNRIIISRASYDQIDPSLFEVRTLGHIDGFPTECFDLYQADDPELKSFKNLTKEEFEKAVGIMSNSKNPIERKEAEKIFENLRAKANLMNLTDSTVLQKLRELSNTAPNTPALSGACELPIIVPTSPTNAGNSHRGTLDSNRHEMNLPHSVAMGGQ